MAEPDRKTNLLAAGTVAPAFRLPKAGGGSFDSPAMAGDHWLLSFQRYAA